MGRPNTAVDYYPTPGAVTRALLRACPPDEDKAVIEPSAGEGHIVRELGDWGYTVSALELREECTRPLAYAAGLRDHCQIGDWLHVASSPVHLRLLAGPPPYQIVANPPYSNAAAHVRACLSIAAVYVAMLLPTGMLHGQSRKDLPAPSYLLPFIERIDLTGAGGPPRDVSWWVWTREAIDEPWGVERTEILRVTAREERAA